MEPRTRSGGVSACSHVSQTFSSQQSGEPCSRGATHAAARSQYMKIVHPPARHVGTASIGFRPLPRFFCLARAVRLGCAAGMSRDIGRPAREPPSSLDDELRRPSVLEKDGGDSSDGAIALQFDQRGLPLVPQPSGFRDDPLVSSPDGVSGTDHSPAAELAPVAEMGRPRPSRLHGLSRPIRLRRGQSQSGPAE